MQSYIFTGYAALPHDAAKRIPYSSLGVIAEVDAQGRIIAAEASLSMGIGNDFFARLATGRSVISERQEILSDIRDHYLGHAQGALLAAVESLFRSVDRSALLGGVAGAENDAATSSDDGGHGV